MDKRFLAIIGVIAAIFIGILIFSQSGKDKSDGSNSKSTAQATNHVKGEKR